MMADRERYMQGEPEPDERHGAFHVQGEGQHGGSHEHYQASDQEGRGWSERVDQEEDDRSRHEELDMEVELRGEEVPVHEEDEEEGEDARRHQQATHMGLAGHQGYLQVPMQYRRDGALEEEEQQRLEEQQRGQLLQYTALGGTILDSHSLNLALAQQQLAHQQLAQQQLAQQQLAQQQLAQQQLVHQHLAHQQMAVAGPGMQHGEAIPLMGMGKQSKKRRKLKRLEIDLDPISYQKLMKLVNDQFEGSVERFLSASLAHVELPEKPGKKDPYSASRKPALTKWKRLRFEHLRGGDSHELSLAHRSLLETLEASGQQHYPLDITPQLRDIPWEDLTIPQLEKMLDEVKRMLIMTEKVHSCTYPDCGRTFATPGNLRDHENEHRGHRPYQCPFEGCGMAFSSKTVMCRHVKKHERAHICPYEGCGKRFAFRERLITHQKIHSDERPLHCPWEGCDKTFKWANSLHGHMRTHTGEKPFQCTWPNCGRQFGYKVDLTRHERTHYGQPARRAVEVPHGGI